jgi:hypothetical protein
MLEFLRFYLGPGATASMVKNRLDEHLYLYSRFPNSLSLFIYAFEGRVRCYV